MHDTAEPAVGRGTESDVGQLGDDRNVVKPDLGGQGRLADEE